MFYILHNLCVYDLFQILLLFCQPFGSMECVCVCVCVCGREGGEGACHCFIFHPGVSDWPHYGDGSLL